MDLSVILVYYKTRDHLVECLEALRAGTGALDVEILVVDNDSRDGIAGMLQQSFPAVRLLTNPGNFGYSRAVNRGIAESSGEFVLVMNPDCTPRPGMMQSLIDHLRSHPGTAIAGPKILNPDGTLEYSARAFPDHMAFLFNRYSLLTRLFPDNPFSRRYLLTDWDHGSVRDVDWLSGACLMARRAAIARVGGMDEAFFMFNEDVDWCRRMGQGGWNVTYIPAAVAVHHVGASRKRVSVRVIYGRHLGMIHYFHKHHPVHPLVSLVADSAILVRAGLMIILNAFKLR